MLHAKTLPKLLEQAVGNGVTCVMLLNEQGEMIGVAPSGAAATKHRHTGAIVASIWDNAVKLSSSSSETTAENNSAGNLKELLFDCENGRIGVFPVSKFLICMIVSTATSGNAVQTQQKDEFGMIKRKAHALVEKLEQPLNEWLVALKQPSQQQQQQTPTS